MSYFPPKKNFIKITILRVSQGVRGPRGWQLPRRFSCSRLNITPSPVRQDAPPGQIYHIRYCYSLRELLKAPTAHYCRHRIGGIATTIARTAFILVKRYLEKHEPPFLRKNTPPIYELGKRRAK